MKNESANKLLIITHKFPPIGGVAGMRMLKFAKYLPEYGWHPIVLTVTPHDCYDCEAWGTDTTLLTQVEGRATIRRIPSPL